MSTYTNLSAEQIENISTALVSARNEKRCLDVFPGDLPHTLEQAYELQDMSIAAYDQEIVGWKVGMVPPELREQLKSERLMGPVFKNVRHFIGKAHQDDEQIELPVFENGFIAVEAEIIIEIAQDIEPGTINTADGVAHLVKEMYAGIEIASSPVRDLNSYGPTAIISDFGNNHGMIVGAPIANWQTAIQDLETQVLINGELINKAPSSSILNGQLAALAYIIDTSAQRNIKLKAGDMICSGAITGVHETVVGAKSTTSFAGAGNLNIELVAI
ncbi:2-keto-4-pentenoate hydratase [Algibacillus agarilyticus]|uniref:2-keto-4-pentenoate hydratase n=1 Tax=Algibacillus agarilyticus TaxID=2234133 RepID=UPI000DCF725E|nr:hypothetical protein [Algibacillus agarilyticus]